MAKPPFSKLKGSDSSLTSSSSSISVKKGRRVSVSKPIVHKPKTTAKTPKMLSKQ